MIVLQLFDSIWFFFMYTPESYVLESLYDTTYIFLIRLFLTRSIVGIIVREFLFKY